MDSITHIVLGATIGEALAGKSLGKKAMLIGAIAQSLPDIDFILSIWLRPVDNLLAHRGFTHSILFGLIICLLAGVIASAWSVKTPTNGNGMTRTQWMVFFGVELGVHLFLDGLNNYGVGWLEPFNSHRFAFDVIYVADPFYSVWIGIGCVALIVLSINAPSRKRWTQWTLIVSSLYLVYALFNKVVIENSVQPALQKQHIVSTRVFTTPTPLNNWLWFVAAEGDSGYYVAHRSVFDGDDPIDFTFFPRKANLLDKLKEKEDLQKLIRFSQGLYTIDVSGDALQFNDLRFGQIAGWADPHAKFAFHYDLLHPDANLFVVQQGRFSNWNEETVRVMVKRIVGKR
jgi:inner membrane protein